MSTPPPRWGAEPVFAGTGGGGGQPGIGTVMLRTMRLVLRPIEPNDLGQWLQYCDESDGSFRPYFPTPDSLDPLLRFDLAVQKTLVGFQSGTAARFMAFDVGDGRIVGQVALNMIVRGVMESCVMGWAVHPAWQRRGFGAEMCRSTLGLAFAPALAAQGKRSGLGLHRVGCSIMPRNVASLRLAARLGFRQEGLSRKYLRINGMWEDHVMFSQLAEEFLA